MSADRERALRLGMDRTRQEVLAGPADAIGNGSRHGAGTVVPIGSDAAARNAQRQREDLVLLLSVADVARALGLGRSKTYELIAVSSRWSTSGGVHGCRSAPSRPTSTACAVIHPAAPIRERLRRAPRPGERNSGCRRLNVTSRTAILRKTLPLHHR